MSNRDALLICHKIQKNILKIEQELDLIEFKEREKNMVDPKVAALITQFDNATDKIAIRIQKIISAGGLSAESEAALQAEVDKLNLLGQDAENPVPSTLA